MYAHSELIFARRRIRIVTLRAENVLAISVRENSIFLQCAVLRWRRTSYHVYLDAVKPEIELTIALLAEHFHRLIKHHSLTFMCAFSSKRRLQWVGQYSRAR